jgi:hypothetical protein
MSRWLVIVDGVLDGLCAPDAQCLAGHGLIPMPDVFGNGSLTPVLKELDQPFRLYRCPTSELDASINILRVSSMEDDHIGFLAGFL